MLATEDSVIYDAAETIYQLSEDERIRQECEAREDSHLHFAIHFSIS